MVNGCTVWIEKMISYEPLFRTMAQKGITSYRLMKLGDNVSTHTVNQLCRILTCNVWDIMEYAEETEVETQK